MGYSWQALTKETPHSRISRAWEDDGNRLRLAWRSRIPSLKPINR